MSTDVGPTRTSETPQARPVLDLQLAHAMQKYIERHAKKLVPHNDVRISSVEVDCEYSASIIMESRGWHTKEEVDHGSFIPQRLDLSLPIVLRLLFESIGIPFQRSDVSIYSTGE